MRLSQLILFFTGVILMILGMTIVEGASMTIHNGSKVAFDYTLTVDGEVVDTSQGRGPLEYVQGQGQIIPGLAKQMEGLKVGDERKIVVSPEDAYGMVNPQAYQEIDKSALKTDQELKVGMIIQATTPEGKTFPVRISEVKDDTFVVDFNHPLAGKTLEFEVKIVSIQ